MSFLISDAVAEVAAESAVPMTTTAETAVAPAIQEPGWEGMLFPIGILIFFYFIFLRPQSKRTKEHKSMLDLLK
jgi:preprotein translocase subunit YajC